MPFGLHQLLEYLLAGALVELSVHLGRGLLLLIGGVALALAAATAKGPLGALRLCGRRSHRWVDLTVAGALALAPVVPALRPTGAGIAVVEVAALGWMRLTAHTDYAAPTPAGAAISRPGPAATGPSSTERRLRAGARLTGEVPGRLRLAWRGARGGPNPPPEPGPRP
ncbi:MAG TPA: hypothetical protein VMV14_09520 [Acidimicrobiales bacterium]|nr:hypothetical protein [Acidimicrobiales bacterium]